MLVAAIALLTLTACKARVEGLRSGQRVEIARSRGEPPVVRGEVLHVYDLTHDILHPERRGGRVVAVVGDAGAEGDRAIEIVPDGDISRVTVIDERPATMAPIVLERLPVEGVWRVHEDGSGYHAREGGCGDFALDLDDGGPGGARNEDYPGFGQKVVAPAAGRVSVAVGAHPDHAPTTTRGETPANAVFIDLRGAFAVGMYHFARGSLAVREGDSVARGAELGRVGNSGTSYGPHLHLGVFWRRGEVAGRSCHGWSVPFVLESLYVSPRRTGGVKATSVYPKTGTWVSNTPF